MWFIIEGYNRDNSIRTGTIPSQMEGIVTPCHFQNDICTTMVTVLENKILAVFRFSHQHIRIMLADKPNSFRRLFTDNNAFWFLQHHTQQSTNPGRPGTDDKNSIFHGYFRDACCPKACCKHITDKQSLFITHCIRNTIQTLIRIRNSDIFRLTAINSAT